MDNRDKKERECVPGGCEFYDAEEDRCTAFVCDGIDCGVLPCEEDEDDD